MMTIAKTLKQRQKTHGDFGTHAVISQHLKGTMHFYEGYRELNPVQMEALEMIAHKIARILNGNPDHHDHWHDIAGYATLVAETLE
jgi:Domain of unknown function (DUF6378)